MSRRALLFVMAVSAVAIVLAFAQNSDGKLNPQITLSNHATCNLSNGHTFRVRGSGFSPASQAEMVVFYPNSGTKYAGKVYTYLKPVVQIAPTANFVTHPWDCLNGPGGKPDPAGRYMLVVVDRSGRSVAHPFDVVKR